MSDLKFPPPTGEKWELRDKGISSREDILHIFKTLPPTVKTLDLRNDGMGSENRIGSEGAIAIAESLKVNNTLQHIDLGDNQIGDEGAIAIAESLKVNNTLQQVYLGGNPVGQWGGEALYASIAHNDHLKELWINRQWIPSEFVGMSLDKFAVSQLLWNMDKME